MEQKIETPTSEDQTYIEVKRQWVKDHYEPESQHKYDTVDGKLILLDAIIKNKWIEPEEKVKLQNLGITLGDALAQKLNMRWMTVEDDSGRDPCIVLEGTSIVLFPLTMISKRIEQGEDVDVYGLFEDITSKVEEVKIKQT